MSRFVILSYLLFVALVGCIRSDDFLDSFLEGEEDSYMDEEGYGEDSVRYQLDNALDLLEKHQKLKLQAEEFIYPFAIQHEPMLTANLIPSVVERASGFRNTTVSTRQEPSKPASKMQSLAIKNEVKTDFAAIIAQQNDVRRKDEKDKPVKQVELPAFEISGKFGTEQDQFIIIGNRYYAVDERLKGARDLRQVKLIGIDEHMAYFSYQDSTFAKKIKALERIF
ncbi:MAG: hypothetical protein H3C47_00130 [Candidatus Cloacimonetes bacterium]|nr:hypothetical protein [Candidatus Cloacimonadota bacterium]